MNIRCLSLSLILTFILGSSAFAEDHGGGHEAAAAEHGGGGDHEEKKEEDHGEKKAESGGHEEAKTTLAPWVEVENKIQELYSKIQAKEGMIVQMLEEKDHMPNGSPMLQKTVKEIVREHKELRLLVEEYDKKLNILKYRFPERNAKHEKTHGRIQVKSIDDMELSLGVDGKLSRNMKKMRNQYGLEAKPDPVIHQTAPKKSPASVGPQSIEEAGSIILQK